MTYNKITYWNKRKDPNNPTCRELTPKHIDLIRPLIEENKNVLEYGPGIGRMIELFRNQNSVNFYDISAAYKDRLESKFKENKIDIDKFIIDQSGTIKTDFNNDEFDIVFCFEVLLHSPPNDIIDLMRELARIGKTVIVTTWYENGNELGSTHCWTRDYKKILDDLGFKILHWDSESLDKQILFVYEK